jgi:serine/threonine-protein phosphatase 2A activator
LIGFIRLCNEKVKGVSASDSFRVNHVSILYASELAPMPNRPGHPMLDPQVVEKLCAELDSMYGWVDEIPPLQQPMRFGNRAFRSWHARLVERAPALIQSLLSQVGQRAGEKITHHGILTWLLVSIAQDTVSAGAVDEVMPYLTSSFGHETRLDYGTGHETAFAVFLFCLFKLQAITVDDLPVSDVYFSLWATLLQLSVLVMWWGRP